MDTATREYTRVADIEGTPDPFIEHSADLNAQQRALLAALRTPGHRRLPEFTLYDPLGSALFHARTLLDEYDVFRVENALLLDIQPDIVEWAEAHRSCPTGETSFALAASKPSPDHMTQCWVADLGCGSGLKTRVIVEAIAALMPTTLFAIDISAAALRQCAFTMSDLTAVKVTSFEGSYLPGLEALRDSRQNDAPLLALFLGSSISQFAVHEIEPFLGQVRALMRPGDAILIGADGIRSLAEMIAQYNDVLGIEAAFDKNALNVVNRTLGGNFDIASFDYTVSARMLDVFAPFELAVVERALVARTAQHVVLSKAEASLDIEAGEHLALVHSVKFGVGTIAALAARAGFVFQAEWRDAKTGFADTLLYCPSNNGTKDAHK